MGSHVDKTVHSTPSSVDKDVSGSVTSMPQLHSEQDDFETGMEFSKPEEGESNISGDATNDEFETKEKLMSRAGTIMNDWISRLMGGREAALILPRANPVIPLVKEIADRAQFSLTEKPVEDESNMELIHEGAEGMWSDLSQTDSYDEPSKGSVYHQPDTDQEDAIILDMQVVEDQEERQSSQSDTRPSLEDVMVSARPRTEPSHPYQPPQITEAQGGWYEGEDCFDPGQITPSASPQLLPSPDGGLNWGGDEAMPPFRMNRPPFRGRSIQRVVYHSRTIPGNNGKTPKLSREARRDRWGLASAHFQKEVFWQQAVRDYQYYPAVDDSPIHFFPPEGYGEDLKAVPFNLLVPLALEVPYLDGLAQEALPDRLIPASLYGLTVMRPAYTAEAVEPKSITATKTIVDSGRAYRDYIIDGDVEAYQDHSCYVGRSPQYETEGVFTCSHPGCVGVEGFGAYFASTEQFVAHWNTFHMAISVGYNCP